MAQQPHASMLPDQVSTLIGYGSPNKADTHDVHGAPLGKDETAATRKNLGWPYGEFEVRPPDRARPYCPCLTSGLLQSCMLDRMLQLDLTGSRLSSKYSCMEMNKLVEVICCCSCSSRPRIPTLGVDMN